MKLSHHLELDSCPHCGKAHPTLEGVGQIMFTHTHNGGNPRCWANYACKSCGGVVSVGGPGTKDHPYATTICEIYPCIQTIAESIPEKPRAFLQQAQDSLHAPAGAIMLCASAIDAMLKEKKYTEGSLNARIDQAAKDHLITDAMAQWAHQVRLDANEQRHADKGAGLPDHKDANLSFDFAVAFAEYLFVLPARVTRGMADATKAKPA